MASWLGDIAVDDRGKVSFVNDFDFKGIKRFYMVENHEKGFVRAWHGHKHEEKYVYVVTGSILIGIVPLEPTEDTFIDRRILSADKPEIMHIPKNYANGFKTLTDDAKVIFFSTKTLEESKGDDIRFPAKHWDIWEVTSR